MKKAVFAVSGIDCSSCALGLEDRLAPLKGVKKAAVNYAAGRAFVDFDEKKTTADGIGVTIKKAGYDFVLVKVE